MALISFMKLHQKLGLIVELKSIEQNIWFWVNQQYYRAFLSLLDFSRLHMYKLLKFSRDHAATNSNFFCNFVTEEAKLCTTANIVDFSVENQLSFIWLHSRFGSVHIWYPIFGWVDRFWKIWYHLSKMSFTLGKNRIWVGG